MDRRVKSLDTPSEHLRRLCNGRDVVNGEVGLADHFGGAARGEQSDATFVEALCQVKKTGLVVDGEDGWDGQCCFYGSVAI